MASHPRLGDLLVGRQMLTGEQRDTILERQKTSGRPFGELAEIMFGIGPEVIEQAWAEQYAAMATWIDPRAVRPEPRALALVDRRQAWQFRVLPLALDGEEVRICTSHEHLIRAVRFTGWHLSTPCHFVLADSAALGEALAQHYTIPGITPRWVSPANPS